MDSGTADVEMSVLYTQLKPLFGIGARGDMEVEASTPKTVGLE